VRATNKHAQGTYAQDTHAHAQDTHAQDKTHHAQDTHAHAQDAHTQDTHAPVWQDSVVACVTHARPMCKWRAVVTVVLLAVTSYCTEYHSTPSEARRHAKPSKLSTMAPIFDMLASAKYLRLTAWLR